ncbi:MAG TPA: hypothetical protein DEB18_16505 [Leeuwenhoekiella sp.]|nr:hypothetical protein [Leeuwenhoekiella sp.]
MKISRKKLLQIIKEEISDVDINNISGTPNELAYMRLLSKKDPAGSRAAVLRLKALDAKVQYLDQELKKLKNKKQKNSAINKMDMTTPGGSMPRLDETGAKGSMKISEKHLQKIIEEEVQRVILEFGCPEGYTENEKGRCVKETATPTEPAPAEKPSNDEADMHAAIEKYDGPVQKAQRMLCSKGPKGAGFRKFMLNLIATGTDGQKIAAKHEVIKAKERCPELFKGLEGK